MTPALAIFVLMLAVRIGAKTLERRAAHTLVLHILESDHSEAIDVIRSIVPQPTIGNAIARAIIFERAIVRAVYLLFAFSLASVDPRTPNAVLLWDARHRLHALRERDIYDRTRAWERTFLLDVGSAILLAGTIGFALFRFGKLLAG
ncbi:MAG TPA: hypothetical protein VLB83_01110 [Candidatus Paceibacterota bacterium]|nr:hypothetical protein [Candidatus Paceibacterota bacterium]